MNKLKKFAATILAIGVLFGNIHPIRFKKVLKRVLKHRLMETTLLSGPIAKPILQNGFKGSIADTSNVMPALKHNFHKVDGYELYRSKQLNYKNELKYLRKKNINLVLSLRGQHPKESWWQEQKRAAEEVGAIFINTKTSADEYPSLESLLLMLAVINSPQRVINDPIDAHLNPEKYVFDTPDESIAIKVNCMAGADRTSMFCALFIIERELKANMSNKEANKIFEKAKKQLSLKYKHVKKLHPTMDRFIKDWFFLRKGRSLEEALTLYPNLLADRL